MTERQPRVSDFIGCPYDPVREISCLDAMGMDLLFREFTIREGRFGNEAHILCEVEESELCVRTTSEVVMGDLEILADKLPLLGTVTKPGRYYKLQ